MATPSDSSNPGLRMTPQASESRLSELMARLAALPQGESETRIRDDLFEIAFSRMESLAHRMIRGFPHVRRWEDTADVLQAAGLRLHRALLAVDVRDERHLLRLAAIQIRRELLDLARKYTSPESFAVHHETNSFVSEDGLLMKVDQSPDTNLEPIEQIDSWTKLHAAVASLPADEREIFDLVWFLGATQHEVAKMTGSSARTVRRQWEIIKRRLVAELKDISFG